MSEFLELANPYSLGLYNPDFMISVPRQSDWQPRKHTKLSYSAHKKMKQKRKNLQMIRRHKRNLKKN